MLLTTGGQIPFFLIPAVGNPAGTVVQNRGERNQEAPGKGLLVRPARLRFPLAAIAVLRRRLPSATWLPPKPETLTLIDLAGFLVNGSTHEQAAEALSDIELLRQFKKVEQLPQEKEAVVKELIDAFLLKHDIQQKFA